MTLVWVTAILYSQLATRGRSPAIILHIHLFTITRVHLCHWIPIIIILMPMKPNIGVHVLTMCHRVINLWYPHWLPLLTTMRVIISCPPPKVEYQRSINSLCVGSASWTFANCPVLFLNSVLNGHSFQYVSVYNFTNKHAMSHRTDFCSILALELKFKNQLSALIYRNFGQCFELSYPFFKVQPQCRIQNLQTPCWKRLWYLLKMDVSLFAIWVTLLWESYSMLDGLQWQ